MYTLIRITSIFLLTYYLIGNLCLPQGDFSSLTELKEMYDHCKATEDHDMTVVDFITDHLINFDCLIDNHNKGDLQKSHTSLQYHHQAQNYFLTKKFIVDTEVCSVSKEDLPTFQVRIYYSNFRSSVFRPPIV